MRERHPDVLIVCDMELPGGLLGCTDHDKRIIWLDSRLCQAERRSTLAHEIGHLHRGPVPVDPIQAALEERLVDEWASRKLIDGRALAAAFRWSPHYAEIAEELWVDEHTLRARLRCMTDEEQDMVLKAICDHRQAS